MNDECRRSQKKSEDLIAERSATMSSDAEVEWAPVDWPIRLERPGFRLPTSAEWMTACRSGAQTMYNFGSDAEMLSRYAWYAKNSENLAHPPKQLRPGLRGQFDLHGNLSEWCHDCFGDYDPDSLVNPLKVPQTGEHRVFRGGGWGGDARRCRTSFSFSRRPNHRSPYLGFRIALTLPDSTSHNRPNSDP
jgi:formylglycine-generating enzyme required for sulfatase activity